MTIHLFYFKPLDSYQKDPSTLYAFTDDKNLANEFMNQRDMDKFIYVKERDMIKEEYNFLVSSNSKRMLTHGKFHTKSKLFGKNDVITITCTWYEEEAVFRNIDKVGYEYSKNLFDCKCFKSKYLRVLEKLLFIKNYKFYSANGYDDMDPFYVPYYNNYGPSEDFVLEDFKESFSVDELSIFLRFFKDTFIIEEDNDDES